MQHPPFCVFITVFCVLLYTFVGVFATAFFKKEEAIQKVNNSDR